jgi:hypothetical protein
MSVQGMCRSNAFFAFFRFGACRSAAMELAFLRSACF